MHAVLFDWPYLGLALALLLMVVLATERRTSGTPRWSDPAFVLPLLWPMYLLHQFEEHGIDLRGRHYAFLEGLCAGLGHAHDLAHCPADAAFIFAVNVLGCQVTFAFSWLYRRRNPLVAACAWGVAIVNAVTHIGTAIAHGEYNPGLLTSLLLFVPLSAWMLRTVLRAGLVRRGEVPRIVASGVLIHLVLVGSLLLHERGALPRNAMLVANALNGLWPLLLGNVGVRRAKA